MASPVRNAIFALSAGIFGIILATAFGLALSAGSRTLGLKVAG